VEWLGLLGVFSLYMRRRKRQNKGTKKAGSEGYRIECLINEPDESGARLEDPGIKSEIAAELPTEVKTAELQADNTQDIEKNRNI
jgi:hypothetical protein